MPRLGAEQVGRAGRRGAEPAVGPTVGRVAGLAAVVACGVGLAGCKSVPREEYDAAIAENNELRERVVALQSSVEQSEADKASLQDENARLSSDLQQARSSGPSPTAGDLGVTGATLRGSDVVVSVAGDVLFSPGQATIKNDGKRELDRIAREVQQRYPNARVRVEGYTDTDPIRKSGWKTNERLSAERALAVEAYLVSRGLDPDRVYSAAMGPANPRATKQQSRRVEIVILGS